MIVVGIDPGTGSSSACGISAFDSATRRIVLVRDIWARKYETPTWSRLKDVSEQVGLHVEDLVSEFGGVVVGIESFVMQGKAGATLQRFIGAALTRLPYEIVVHEIQNTTAKKFVGGKGSSDKAAVAQGVADFFKEHPESTLMISQLIKNKEWDSLDSLAIGITAANREGLLNASAS